MMESKEDVKNIQTIDLNLFKALNHGGVETAKSTLSQIQKVWEEKNTNSAFYDVTKIIIRTMRLTGRYPFYIKEGTMSIKIVSPLFIASLVVFGSQCFVAYLELPNMINNVFFTADFDVNILSGMFSLFLIYQLALPITAWLEWSSLCSYYNHWRDFEIELKKKTGIELERGVAKILYALPFLELPLVIYLGVAEYDMFTRHASVYTIVVFGIISINLHMYLYLWIFSCLFIGKAADSLLNYVLKIATQEVEVGKSIELSNSRLLWLRISELATMLADTLAPTMLLCFLVCGVAFVMASYALLYYLKIGKTNEHTLTYVSFLLVTCTIVVLICDSAHRTTQKIGQNFSSGIMKIDTSSLSDFSRKELDSLINTTGVNPPELMFAGFFTINRHLFVSFLSSTITYLIVMVQFKSTDTSLLPPVKEW